ncbi:type I-E CRISPR-associated protein Cse1/CasA, partial [Streptomyces alkaliterrae]
MPIPPPSAVSSFDLTAQPWLPVLYTSGDEGVVSLAGVLAEAHGIRRLVGDVPTQEFALTRLLLAILYDALDDRLETIADWAELWRQDTLPVAEVAAYLRRHREGFDLLHPTRPFFQVADLRTAKDEVFALDRIVADVPNGDRFFTMRSGGVDSLSFAEAARWLVHSHAYDPSGIKSGAVGDPRVKGGKGYPLGVGWA